MVGSDWCRISGGWNPLRNNVPLPYLLTLGPNQEAIKSLLQRCRETFTECADWREISDTTQMKDKTILNYYVQLKVVLQTVHFWFQTCMMMYGHTPNSWRMLCWEVYIFLYQDLFKKKTFIYWRAALLETVKDYLVHTGKHFEKRRKQKTKTGGNGNCTMCVFLNLDCDKEYNDGFVWQSHFVCFLPRSTKWKGATKW